MPQLIVCQRASRYHLWEKEALLWRHNSPTYALVADTRSICGANPIYIAAKLTLRVRASEPHQKLAESQQVNRAEGGAAGGNSSKLVYRIDVGQIGRNRAQPPLVVTVGDPILAPMAAPADEIELAARLRMKGVGDADPAVGRTRTVSS